MTDEPAAFGPVLRRLRTAAALSQEGLAERAGLSPRGISDLERGVRRTPHLTTVNMLADALELGPADRQALLAAARPRSLPEQQAVAPGGYASLPTPLTSLIGREQELAALTTLLTQGTIRLVTVTGVGGAGKTRLALEAGARLQDEFVDGVVFVDLSPLREGDLVLTTIGRALGVRERAGQRLLDTLAGVLAPQQLLLLLDNCEQVLEAAPDIAALLMASPRVSILATSREPLRVRGERVLPLPPLPLPNGRPFAFEEVAGVPAVALFVERAAGTKPDFAVTPENAAAVAAICRRLDGLPLAIELAAARIGVLSPAALLARLETRLPVLTGGSRDLPPRQRTMRDAIAWSYDLLDEKEQRLFRRLAVFAGGWTLEAATELSGGQSDLAILEGLEALAAASLVQANEQADGERRFSMLETIREFGLEQLAASQEEEVLRGRHTRYFVDLAGQGEASNFGATEHSWSQRLLVERANLRAALLWSAEHGQTEAFLRLVASLAWFWDLWGDYAEGRQWVERAIAVRQDVADPGVRVKAAFYTGWFLAFFPDQWDRHRTLIEESLALAHRQGDQLRIGRARYQLTVNLSLQHRWDEARRALESLIPQLRAAGDPSHVVAASNDLARIYLRLGQVERARRLADEALALARHEQIDRGVMWLTSTLVNALVEEGSLVRATALLREAMALVARRHDMPSLVMHLVDAARICMALDQPLAAAKLLGTAKAIDAALGGPTSWYLEDGDGLRRSVIQVMGDAAFAQAIEAVRLVTFDEAVNLVDELLPGSSSGMTRASG